MLFGYSLFINYQKKTNSEDKIANIISAFEEKFKNDSIYLSNVNKLLIDKISQHILDSISSSYERKLEIVLKETNKYKQLLIKNNIDFEHISTNNIPTQSKIDKLEQTSNQKPTANVTTYSKLIIKKTDNSNINNSSIVTTYSKINTNKKPIKTNSNVTTYSKLIVNKNKTDNSSLNNSNDVQINKVKGTSNNFQNNNNLIHNNYILDTAENINDIDLVPVYNGCENLTSEKERKNCFAINISKHILNNFNTENIQSIGLKKGINKVRVLFIIDKNGYAKIGKLVGEWPHKIYENTKKTIKSIPKMKPGYDNNKPVPIKYSLLIPFIVK